MTRSAAWLRERARPRRTSSASSRARRTTSARSPRLRSRRGRQVRPGTDDARPRRRRRARWSAARSSRASSASASSTGRTPVASGIAHASGSLASSISCRLEGRSPARIRPVSTSPPASPSWPRSQRRFPRRRNRRTGRQSRDHVTGRRVAAEVASARLHQPTRQRGPAWRARRNARARSPSSPPGWPAPATSGPPDSTAR